MQLAERYQMLIGGQWTEGAEGEFFTTCNPATGETLAQVAQATESDVDRAVAAARKAFEGAWARTSPAQRGRILWRVAERMRERLDELAQLETLNCGKAIAGVKAEVAQAADNFEYFAGAATKIFGETLPAAHFLHTYTVPEPVGVCAAIVPWNYPLMLASWKLAPALAAGCTVVLKPASATPLSALVLAAILQEAGLPEGVVNVVTGPGSTVGAYLAAHPGVDKVAFTGETATGRAIMAAASTGLKRVSLELGGKSPNLVFADADLDAAVQGSLWAIYTSGGESCEARSRLFVQDEIYDDFLARFVSKANTLRVGDPLDPTVHIGSLISRSHRERVHSYVQLGLEEGAELAAGGSPPDAAELGPRLAAGAFYRPTVLTGVRNTMRVAQEEIFGPVVTVLRFRDEREALREANDVIYGLAATVFTRDAARAHRVAAGLRAGVVTVNHPFTAFPGTPFGGFKQTGFGRELGLEALRLYTETKTVMVYRGERPIHPFGV